MTKVWFEIIYIRNQQYKEIIYILYQIVAITEMFSLIVLSHEFGHYLAARMAGVKVKKFSLCFGPAMLKKKVGDTEYVLSLFPLGGYIKMTGEDSEEEVR